jgi:hypothetical protein
MSLPSGVVTFLFTDVVGSSARWDRHAAPWSRRSAGTTRSSRRRSTRTPASSSRRQHTVVSRLYLAASLHQLGRHDEARSEVAAARDQVPEISAAMLEQIEAYRDSGDEARLTEVLRGAGLPAS